MDTIRKFFTPTDDELFWRLRSLVWVSYLKSSSLTAHAGRPLVKWNEDAKYEGEVAEETFLPSHAFPYLPSPILHPPRRARKALEVAFSRARYYGGPKLLIFQTEVLISFNIITYRARGGSMLVTCDVLLVKKAGTKPQMTPNFKGGFRSGPRGRGHPFSLKFCITVIELSEKIQSISTDDKWAHVPATPFWIFWIRPWISAKNDPVKSLDREWCWVLEQRIYRVDVFLSKI